MTEFTLDTSGAVHGTGAKTWLGKDRPWVCYWTDLSPFVQGYVEALFASASFDTAHARDCEYVVSDGPAPCTCPAGRFGYRRPLRFDWLSPEALALILQDYEAAQPLYYNGKGWGDAERGIDRAAGRDFWRNRQDGASSFPPLRVYLNDEGKVCLAVALS